MSVSSIQSGIERIQRALETLHRKQTDAMRKESSLTQRISQASQSITRTTQLSIIQSKQREIQRLEGDVISCQKTRADVAKQIADKTAELHREQQRLFKEQERDRKSALDTFERRDREMRAENQRLIQQLAVRRDARAPTAAEPGTALPSVIYDAFISHATEDKEAVARPLAERLRELGFEVWYDDFQLKVGDSLRRSIDRGLANSRFGIVVLSSAFFSKNWPQYELDGLVARESMGGKVILPLWHKISKDEVMAFSPSLADKLALNTSVYSIEELAQQLADVLRQ